MVTWTESKWFVKAEEAHLDNYGPKEQVVSSKGKSCYSLKKLIWEAPLLAEPWYLISSGW